ncbi:MULTISPECIES: hypothetical protein [unclassified Microcoleus]|uniref:hypothetical protein n=1 Tax=unclassified Microcoleus TaxID=2642155 RepID=UPI0025E20563|nr:MULTISPECIES: hypothetical protein [unclassified Microcoleus]
MNHYKLAIQQDIIVQLLAQLTVDYQNTKSERKEIAQSYLGSEEEFSFLEELELVTVSIRGYASQIQGSQGVEDRDEAIASLHQLRVFDRSAIAQFYDETRSGYLQMRSYIRMLDYLRLLVLEYL